MNLDDVRLVYGLACLALCLIIASPSIGMIIALPPGERFSELWLLGENHLVEGYPHNITAGNPYRIYVGVRNHMGGLEYYRVVAKFRNASEPLPDVQNGTASPLPSVFEWRFFLVDNQTWEQLVTFSFDGIHVENNVTRVDHLIIDEERVFVNKTCVFDAEAKGFYCQLFFELWRYNMTAAKLEFHDRFVSLQLNMTGT
jgi:uncharacterized membrane protein